MHSKDLLTSWYLQQESCPSAFMLIFAHIPLCLPVFSQPIYLTRPGSIARQPPATGCNPASSALARCWLCCLTPLSAEGGTGKRANSPASPHPGQESRPAHPSPPQPHRAASLTNALVVTTPGNPLTWLSVSTSGVPLLSGAVPWQQCQQITLPKQCQGACVGIIRPYATLIQLL